MEPKRHVRRKGTPADDHQWRPQWQPQRGTARPSTPPQHELRASVQAIGPRKQDVDDLENVVQKAKARKRQLEETLEENKRLKEALDEEKKKVWRLKGDVDDAKEEIEKLKMKLDRCIVLDQDESGEGESW